MRSTGPGQFTHACEIAPALLGEDPSDIAKLWDKLCWAGASVGRSGLSTQAIGAFDVALWDLKAKRAGLSLAKLMASDRRDYTFAQTFPTGTHAMWIYYWLASAGINPMKDAKVITVPPPQMVANMRVGNMDGYCVGEPWGARAIADGIGFTAITTQQIWKDHPEKVLGFTEEFATKNPKTVKAVMRAILEASQWNDKLENRTRMAEVVGQPQYVNAAKEKFSGACSATTTTAMAAKRRTSTT